MHDHSLIIEFKNKRPIELTRFTASLSAVADQFKRFVSDHGGVDTETRLFVHEIRPGSIVAELIELGEVASDLWENRDYIAPFLPVLQDTVYAILNLTPGARDLDRPTIKNVANIVAPVTIDHGSQMNFIDNRGGVLTQNFFVTPPDAATIAYNAQHLLNSQLPQEERFTNEPMVLFQLRDAPPGRSGDAGIIDRFSANAKKLTFLSDVVKRQMLHENGHPFENIYWVSGLVKTAGGNIVAYQIHDLVDVTPRI